MARERVIIMGAAGRDFHNFNVVFRNAYQYDVVAFTATQIPNISGRVYPPPLSGPLYPDGIPIYPEEELERLIRELHVHIVVFAYSDVSHEHVMHRASRALATGADFWLLGPERTMLQAKKPVVAVCATRTGSGKSQTTRYVSDILRHRGYKVAVVRHPMPYGDLTKQVAQRFASYEDLERYYCTIEEREEYEPHLDRGNIVFAGVDYGHILNMAEKEGDIILWDGGNNDLPFYQPDFHIVVTDPLRVGHEVRYHPGETNLRMADVVVINKVDSASLEAIQEVRENIRKINSKAHIIEAASPIFVDDPSALRGRRVLVVEDGPTLTHGEMPFGAGVVAAKKFGAAEIVDPRPYAVGSIRDTFARYPHIGPVLPAMGYSETQISELEETINRTPCDVVLIATPIDIRRVASLRHPTDRVRYELQVLGDPTLEDLLPFPLKTTPKGDR